MRKKQITFALLVIAVFAALAYIAYPYLAPGPTNLGPFASCLKDKGVIFYGAFWCPHCRAQKALFGNAVELLPYNECSNPDASEMQSCKDAGVGSYPTWVFPDGTRLTGEQSLQTLAQKSGCTLPTSTIQ
ncbi:MAG TPA: hypothetical protein VNG29_01555 [Candidatus Paceibacterota bacterium]|nr:hypothetical protein [Candidatus Paceibacterota bacterium]